MTGANFGTASSAHVLYDLADWRNGLAFRDFQFSASGKPVIKIAELKDGVTSQTKLTEQTFDPAFGVEFGDMLFSWSGNPDTSIDVFWWRNQSGWLNQHIFKVSPKKSVDKVYFYYVLRALRPTFAEIARDKQTTGLGHVTVKDLKRLKVSLPLMPEQRAIARVLGALDDKIELNRRMNATLEDMAQTLFRSWFVDFDPVMAKAEGREPDGMDAETAALFPSAFVESELGPIPQAWSVTSLDKAANFLNGLALQKFPPRGESGDLPVIKIAQLRRGTTEGSDAANGDVPPSFIISDGDVLFSWSGSLEVAVWCGGKGALNQHLFKVSSETFPKWFYLQWLFHFLPDFQSIAASKATTMGHIQRHHLTDAKFAMPPMELVNSADKFFAPYLDQIISLRLEARNLATLRDEMLPKLISGEIRLPEAMVAEFADAINALDAIK